MTWHNQEIITPNDFGFVYKITNLRTNRIYIGKKQLFYNRKKKLTKKEKALTPRKRFKRVQTSSGWEKYNGSNKDLLADIANGDPIHKEIIICASSKAQLTYYEVKYQFIYEVLETDSYNDSILGKFYRKIFHDKTSDPES